MPPKLNPKSEARVFESHRQELQDCYRHVLEKHPGLSGEMDLLLTLNQDGQVQDTQVKPPFEPVLDSCVQTHAKSWTYPRPETASAEVPVHMNFEQVCIRGYKCWGQVLTK
jgi:hypothetical protein